MGMENELDYLKAMNQVETLRAISKKISNIAGNELDSSLLAIANNWKGENSKEFIKKGSKLKENMEDTSSGISKVADTLEQICANSLKKE